jgi:hypothetical protein
MRRPARTPEHFSVECSSSQIHRRGAEFAETTQRLEHTQPCGAPPRPRRLRGESPLSYTQLKFALTLLLFAAGGVQAAPPFTHHQGVPKGRAPSERPKRGESADTVSCEFASLKVDPATLAGDNGVKLALYEAALSGKGTAKAKKICSTIEGDPVPVFITVKRGKVKVTHDYSQDRFGAGRFKFIPRIFTTRSYTTRKIKIGYFNDRMEFVELSGGPPGDKRLFLKLKDKEYF